MAQTARSRGEHPQIKTLANVIVKTQASEITQMKRIYGQLFARPFKPDEGAHAALGLSAKQAGMAHSAARRNDHLLSAQSREVAEMNDWRTRWYGQASPSGGVPAARKSSGSTTNGDHGSMDMQH